jgi:cytochrome b561
LAGASSIEHILAKISHGGLYAFMAIMPASGIAMGYYGGKGLPFFTTTLPGVVKTDENKKSTGEIAKQVCYVNFTNRRRLLLTYE